MENKKIIVGSILAIIVLLLIAVANKDNITGFFIDSDCIDTEWTPIQEEVCINERFIQESNCGRTKNLAGTKPAECAPENTVTCGEIVVPTNECERCWTVGTYCSGADEICSNGFCISEIPEGGICIGPPGAGCETITEKSECTIGKTEICTWGELVKKELKEGFQPHCTGFIGCDKVETEEDCQYHECLWVAEETVLECQPHQPAYANLNCGQYLTEQDCLYVGPSGKCNWLPVEE